MIVRLGDDDPVPSGMWSAGGLLAPRYLCMLCGMRMWDGLSVSIHEDWHEKNDQTSSD